MTLTFYKYQGTGNDFIILDNRSGQFPKNNHSLVAKLCDRKFGIGADGLMLLETETNFDFKMVYFNSDGAQSTMCGNGGRCLAAFAKSIGVIGNEGLFNAVDGSHEVVIKEDQVILGMKKVNEVHNKDKYFFLDTGSPHHVQFVSDTEKVNVNDQGAKLRYGMYGAQGANINFVSLDSTGLHSIRTYERGVEGETLSCGTGVTAAAIAIHQQNAAYKSPISLHTKGGLLKVHFTNVDQEYSKIFLEGPAEFVFKGEISI